MIAPKIIFIFNIISTNFVILGIISNNLHLSEVVFLA